MYMNFRPPSHQSSNRRKRFYFKHKGTYFNMGIISIAA